VNGKQRKHGAAFVQAESDIRRNRIHEIFEADAGLPDDAFSRIGVEVSIDKLVENPDNKKFFAPMTGKDFEEFVKNVEKKGLQEPLKVLQNGMVVSGHTRLAAAKRVGMKTVLVRYATRELTEKEVVEYSIGDNFYRRQLDNQQKRMLATELLKLDAHSSDRHIAKLVKASPSTIAVVRKELQDCSKIIKVGVRKGDDGRVLNLPKKVTVQIGQSADGAAEPASCGKPGASRSDGAESGSAAMETLHEMLKAALKKIGKESPEAIARSLTRDFRRVGLL